ncbi:MAG: 1-acyl-sn-glycerol-3-phosphate acyltransferase [Lachnospiraceae bacterium]|nr:1-acyl-sn-glycerol-3-phosphate acyltransferase [Lachnospiraceae bacterium]
MIYKYLRHIAGLLFGIIFKYRVHGVENVPEEGAAILCANHLSMWDPFAVVFALKRLPCFIAKKELFENKLLAWICRDLKAFPVDRGKMDMKAIKTALKVLKDGELLGIFAQGTRVKEGEDVAAKAGVAFFAVKSGAPVIPVAIKTNYRLFSRVDVYFGEPISFEEMKGKKVSAEELNEIAEGIMAKVFEMLEDK